MSNEEQAYFSLLNTIDRKRKQVKCIRAELKLYLAQLADYEAEYKKNYPTAKPTDEIFALHGGLNNILTSTGNY